MNKLINKFYWLETNLCQNCIWNSHYLLIVLVDHLLNGVKKIQKFRKTENLKHFSVVAEREPRGALDPPEFFRTDVWYCNVNNFCVLNTKWFFLWLPSQYLFENRIEDNDMVHLCLIVQLFSRYWIRFYGAIFG